MLQEWVQLPLQPEQYALSVIGGVCFSVCVTVYLSANIVSAKKKKSQYKYLSFLLSPQLHLNLLVGFLSSWLALPWRCGA